MKMASTALPGLCLAVTPSAAKRIPKDFLRCEIGTHLNLRTTGLEAYFFEGWHPVLFDALLVAAAIEFCDRHRQRSTISWTRHFLLQIPVHDPYLWKRPDVMNHLLDALQTLTGDFWELNFIERDKPHTPPTEQLLKLPKEIQGVIPFSDGLDSKAVYGLLAHELGDTLVRIRLGTSKFSHEKNLDRRKPFAKVPYSIRPIGRRFSESSGRSRGFKFAVTSMIAAYLAKAPRIYVPESGQGALGPALTTVGQIHPDYRTHPYFLRKMENFFNALLGWRPHFAFPRLWNTKAQTLADYVKLTSTPPEAWQTTKSCWQQSGQSSVGGKKRQCGICAACMLRRLSVHAAGLEEPKDTYVWENLSAPSLEEGCSEEFKKSGVTEKMKDYAIAGTLHLKHLAEIRSSAGDTKALGHEIGRIAYSCNLSREETADNLQAMLKQHEREWSAFLGSLAQESFINQWVRRNS